MSRGKLKSAFFSENTLSCIVALFFAVPFAFVSSFLILRAMKAIDMIMEFSPNPGNTVLFIVGMFLIFAATALLPVKYTRKMKIAEQLKYE
jgi:ABC-type antimicrobial peptide transport system permease subunit